jgi:hypothetical protein
MVIVIIFILLSAILVIVILLSVILVVVILLSVILQIVTLLSVILYCSYNCILLTFSPLKVILTNVILQGAILNFC